VRVPWIKTKPRFSEEAGFFIEGGDSQEVCFHSVNLPDSWIRIRWYATILDREGELIYDNYLKIMRAKEVLK
jgi:hypothetical protein